MARILVIEDDDVTMLLCRKVLESDGHDVTSASDGEAGWNAIERDQPDLVVSDIRLPGLNGLELLSRVRQSPQFCLTPVVLLSSLSEKVNVRVGMTVGADDYLTKPFDPDDLRQSVESQLNRSWVRRQRLAEAVQLSVVRALDDSGNSPTST